MAYSFFRTICQICCLASVISYSLAPPLYAQKTTGTIFGTVKDSTGALIPGATVEVRNTDTGATRTVQTDDRGAYWASTLSPGNYEVLASKIDFEAAHRTGIGLTVGQAAAIDLTMEVGQVQITETVTVREEAPLVDTAGTST